jgi:hypothetical protein
MIEEFAEGVHSGQRMHHATAEYASTCEYREMGRGVGFARTTAGRRPGPFSRVLILISPFSRKGRPRLTSADCPLLMMARAGTLVRVRNDESQCHV